MSNELRDRVTALIAALEAARVHSLTIVLDDVTPEQLVAAYPGATIRTWVSVGENGRGVAIDGAKVPSYPDVEAQLHREPTDEERAEAKTRPYNTPSQNYFHGGE